MNEKDFKKNVLDFLSSDFDIIEEEAYGKYRSKRTFIDAVIKPKDTTLWRNKDIIFGLEFKSPQHIKKQRKLYEYMKQSVDYTHVDWKNYKNLFIINCPNVSFHRGNDWQNENTFDGQLHRFLGAFMIGEFINYDNAINLVVNNNILWRKKAKSLKGEVLKSASVLKLDFYTSRR